MNGLVVALLGVALAVVVAPSRAVAGRLRNPVARRLRAPVASRLPSVSLAAMVRRPRRLLASSAVGGAVIGLLLGGPVAAFVLAVGLLLGARAVVRRTARNAAAAARSRSLDDLSALAADLRAGLPPAAVTPSPTSSSSLSLSSSSSSSLARRTAAVWALADQTGAPAADLVERIEADARAADRARAAASAEAAGAQATATVLMALPLAGIGLGFGLGANPLRILLHTPIGAACAVVAVVLQTTGLLWAERLTAGAAR
jgi:tight adherence protein B